MKSIIKKFIADAFLFTIVLLLTSLFSCINETPCEESGGGFTFYFWNNTNEEVHMVLDEEKLDPSNKVSPGISRTENYWLDNCKPHRFRVGKNGTIIYYSAEYDTDALGISPLGRKANVYWDGTTVTYVPIPN